MLFLISLLSSYPLSRPSSALYHFLIFGCRLRKITPPFSFFLAQRRGESKGTREKGQGRKERGENPD
jgi:hypothetical protein